MASRSIVSWSTTATATATATAATAATAFVTPRPSQRRRRQHQQPCKLFVHNDVGARIRTTSGSLSNERWLFSSCGATTKPQRCWSSTRSRSPTTATACTTNAQQATGDDGHDDDDDVGDHHRSSDNKSMTAATTATTKINITTSTIPQSNEHSQQQQQQQQQHNTSSTSTTTLDIATKDIPTLTATWRNLSICNPCIAFPSWSVALASDGSSRSSSSIHTILNSTLTQPYLSNAHPPRRRRRLVDTDSVLSFDSQHSHVRVKLVHDDPSVSAKTTGATTTLTPVNDPQSCPKVRRKLILLHPTTPSLLNLPEPVRTFLREHCQVTSDGPVVSMAFHYSQLTASYLLERLLPQHIHPVPSSFETVGHVAHLNLRPRHWPYKYLIGDVLQATLPTIETVVAKVGEVSGPYRTYELQVLAGKPDTQVTLVESGVTLQFDLARVYWCSRLSEERRRLLRDEILQPKVSQQQQQQHRTASSSFVDERLVVADVFCGVGALCLQTAVAATALHGIGGVELWVNDWNPDAVNALRENAIRNGVADCFTRVSCGDTYDFLVDLGLTTTTTTGATATIGGTPKEAGRTAHLTTADQPTGISTASSTRRGENQRRRRRRSSKSVFGPTPKTDPAAAAVRLPDHVVMNFPLEAPTFLGAMRWWPADTGIEPRVHVYTFARDQEVTLKDETTTTQIAGAAAATTTTTMSVSAEDVAVDLVANNLLPQSTVTYQRRHELNEEYGCRLKVHTVRDVAPGKRVFCVSFTATSKLLRHMRGNFS